MALINCPECQKEVSDKVENCIHCGYPFQKISAINPQNNIENNGIKKPSKEKKIAIVIITIIVVVIIVGIFYDNQLQNEDNYIGKLRETHIKILSGASIAEDLTHLTRKVWNNSIFKNSNIDTNKFTIRENVYSSNRINYRDSDFLSDFNVALSNLASDPEIIEKKENLIEIQKEAVVLMRNMKNYPRNLDYVYNDLLVLYNSFLELSRLAVTPSGSFNSFTNNVDEIISTLLEYHNKIDLYY